MKIKFLVQIILWQNVKFGSGKNCPINTIQRLQNEFCCLNLAQGSRTSSNFLSLWLYIPNSNGWCWQDLKIDLKDLHIVQQLSLYIWKLGVPAQIKSNFMLVYMVFAILHISFFDILGILDGHASWIWVRVFVFWHISFIY